VKELTQLFRVPVVLIGRMCGQFAKPRTQEYEREGLMSYKGDLINGLNENQREPDPKRLA
jgi:3-deoxy-7-phosphoheptulonate synthase